MHLLINLCQLFIGQLYPVFYPPDTVFKSLMGVI
jgi:hypothetical protein